MDYLASLVDGPDLRTRLATAFEEIERHESEMVRHATARLCTIPELRITGAAPDKAGIVAFTLGQIHPHDIGTILDQFGIAVRAGHHCCMPLMKRFGVPATARASFAFYNTLEEADRLVEGVERVREMFA